MFKYPRTFSLLHCKEPKTLPWLINGHRIYKLDLNISVDDVKTLTVNHRQILATDVSDNCTPKYSRMPMSTVEHVHSEICMLPVKKRNALLVW